MSEPGSVLGLAPSPRMLVSYLYFYYVEEKLRVPFEMLLLRSLISYGLLELGAPGGG